MAEIPPSERPEPCAIVIFGASGDLTQRKLIPSLFELDEKGQLPERFFVVGVSRTKMSDAEFRERMLEFVRERGEGFDRDRWDRFARKLHYHPADAAVIEEHDGLNQRLRELGSEHGVTTQGREPNILYYLSVAPELYARIIEAIGASGAVSEGKRWCSLDPRAMPWQRIVVEKPFGRDLRSAESLNRTLGRVFEEESIYRIDHYMGKELVQNILVMRFANRIFEPVWSHHHVDHVQITAAETLGVGRRAANFYDGSGALRDMIQSHLLQVLTLVAMEPPSRYSAAAMARERVKVLNAIRAIDAGDVVSAAALGRYGRKGDDPAYVEETGVDASNRTDTFCALRVHVDNWRWSGTPFYLRSGKRMARKLTEVVVQFRQPPACLFGVCADRPPNRIIINIAPDDGVSLRFEAKVPGPKLRVESVKMDMDYATAFNAEPVEAYGPLLLDAMRGDRMLYKDRDEVELAWRICQPLLDSAALRASIEEYATGSWGPRGADALMARDGRIWHNPTDGERR